jgi:hypothetical protein
VRCTVPLSSAMWPGGAGWGDRSTGLDRISPTKIGGRRRKAGKASEGGDLCAGHRLCSLYRLHLGSQCASSCRLKHCRPRAMGRPASVELGFRLPACCVHQLIPRPPKEPLSQFGHVPMVVSVSNAEGCFASGQWGSRPRSRHGRGCVPDRFGGFTTPDALRGTGTRSWNRSRRWSSAAARPVSR